jgi:hypothetical protein
LEFGATGCKPPGKDVGSNGRGVAAFRDTATVGNRGGKAGNRAGKTGGTKKCSKVSKFNITASVISAGMMLILVTTSIIAVSTLFILASKYKFGTTVQDTVGKKERRP